MADVCERHVVWKCVIPSPARLPTLQLSLYTHMSAPRSPPDSSPPSTSESRTHQQHPQLWNHPWLWSMSCSSMSISKSTEARCLCICAGTALGIRGCPRFRLIQKKRPLQVYVSFQCADGGVCDPGQFRVLHTKQRS
jgi:hypothetical protein